jgi:hypothetical protein
LGALGEGYLSSKIAQAAFSDTISAKAKAFEIARAAVPEAGDISLTITDIP